MCRYCVEYGNGTKWYLNPENYRKELYTAPGHANGYMSLSGAAKNTFEIGGLVHMEDTLPDHNNVAHMPVLGEKLMQHQGQIVPLEDALKIIGMCPGDRFLLMHCACRRYFGHGDLYSCLFFEPVIERALAERPWETDSKIITKEEAKQLEIEFQKKGLVSQVLDAGTDSDGKPPIVICHCNSSDCMGGPMGHYGVNPLKSEYVIKIDKEKCKNGCTNYPACLPRCQYGALRYSPTEKVVSVNIGQCFGCGLCRSACPSKAMSLVDRLDYPALADVW